MLVRTVSYRRRIIDDALDEMSPDRVVDTVAISTGEYAYRRNDGVAVIPLALLGR